jgi:Spy/CpxP family protein refolding chaperone
VPANEGVVRAASQALVTAETELAIQEAHVYTDVWNALTPDQQAQLKKGQDQRKSFEGRRRGGPRGGGRGRL